jgi:hypothetical protein
MLRLPEYDRAPRMVSKEGGAGMVSTRKGPGMVRFDPRLGPDVGVVGERLGADELARQVDTCRTLARRNRADLRLVQRLASAQPRAQRAVQRRRRVRVEQREHSLKDGQGRRRELRREFRGAPPLHHEGHDCKVPAVGKRARSQDEISITLVGVAGSSHCVTTHCMRSAALPPPPQSSRDLVRRRRAPFCHRRSWRGQRSCSAGGRSHHMSRRPRSCVAPSAPRRYGRCT